MGEGMGKLASFNPRSGERVGTVATSSIDGVNRALERSREVFRDWSERSHRERRVHLKAYKRTVLANMDRIAAVIRAETGKAAGDAYLSDVMPALNVMDFYARTAGKLLRSRRAPVWPYPMVRARTEYRPRGVAAVIAPYNAPFFVGMLGVFPAISAGCSVILKPSEFAPLTGRLIADLAREAGLPGDLVQVVQGDGTIGAALVGSGVDIVFFTGSPETGRLVLAEAAETLTPVTLELGGKDAMVVLDDADVAEAARGAVWGATFLAGQVCISVERVYVSRRIASDFLAAAEEAIDQLSIGTGDANDIGPLIDPQQAGIIEHQVADAVAKGAVIRRGGKRVRIDGGDYFEPTLLTGVDHSMEIMQTETFGPILAVMEVPDEAAALRLADDSRYGLHGSVWSADKGRAARLGYRMDTGTVAVNDHMINVFVPSIPTGGIKDSGFGLQLGPEGLRAFCHAKSVTSPRLIATTRLLLGGRWMPRRVGPRYWRTLARALFRW
jgi:acyl-CoA reductase-like NAD-dependent aldehyde dehydrogenase